jgi:hypothetical protein
MDYNVSEIESKYQTSFQQESYNITETTEPGFTDSGEFIPMIVGEEYTIRGDQLDDTPYLSEDLTVEYECSIGSQSGNDYTITPSEAGNVLIYMTVTVGGTLYRKTYSTIVASAKINTGSSSLILMGDSTVSASIEFPDIRSFFDGMTWTDIGTQEDGGIKHEGHAGKTYEWFATHADSPFTKNGSLDIEAYFVDNGLDVPDFMNMRCGINTAYINREGEFTDQELTEWLGHLNDILDGFLAYDSNIELLINVPTNCDNNGAWNNIYPTDPSVDNYIDHIQKMRNAVVSNYENGAYDSRVSVCYINYNLDRFNGYPTNDALHPNGLVGHPQMVDMVTASLNSVMGSLYGPELVVNGDFATDTVWVKGVNVIISGGAAHLAATPNGSAALTQSGIVAVTTTYRVEFTVSNYSAGGVVPRIGGAFGTTRLANGTYIENITSGAGVDVLISVNGGDATCDIDDISVREVL